MTRLQQDEEKELLSRLRQGDEQAFTALYNRYWERMVTLAYIRLQSAEDAREVVQDVFLDLWNRRSSLDIRNSFHTYIAAAVKYKILTLLARQQKEKERYRQLSADEADRGTEEWLSFQQLRDELEQTIQALPEKCRLVFRLSREAGLSGNEIAKQLEVSPKTVEAHLSKALKILRSSFRKLYTLLV